MKIAHCLECPINQPGGTEVLVRELVLGLSAGHELVLVSSDAAEILRDPIVGKKLIQHIHWNPADVTLASSKKLATTLKAAGIDFAHFHFGSNYAWGNRLLNRCPIIHLSRLGVPCLTTNHGVFGLLEGYIGPQRSFLTKLALLPAAWLSKLQMLTHVRMEIAVSQNDYRSLYRRYWPMRRKFRQVYHSRIHEDEAVAKLPRKKIVLCVGTLGPRKGQTYLAQAFARIASDFPDWKLIFIGRPGDPRTAEELRALLTQPMLSKQAEWLPACSDAELKSWLQSVEIFAMPSLHEGLGLSLQEALFYGCACLATRIGGIPDLIDDQKNGILVERADVDALAKGLARLMQDEQLRRRLSACGQKSVLEKEMTAERMVNNYEKIYRELFQSYAHAT